MSGFDDRSGGRSIRFVDADGVLTGRFSPNPTTGDAECDRMLGVLWVKLTGLQDCELRSCCILLEDRLAGKAPRRTGGQCEFITREGEGERGDLLTCAWDLVRMLSDEQLRQFGALLSAQPAGVIE